jgi:hypothetical protein
MPQPQLLTCRNVESRPECQEIRIEEQELMKKIVMALTGMVFLLSATSARAQLRSDALPALAFGPGLMLQSASGNALSAERSGFQASGIDMAELRRRKKKRRRKRRRKNTLAVGAVAGGPVGFGGRVVFRPSRLAFAGDIAYNRLRTDNGPLVGALTTKLDARIYSKGLIARLLRTYLFAGGTMQRGEFQEGRMQSVWQMDAGIGGGLKLWRLEINGEVGLLIPVSGVEAYQPRFNVFGNVGVLIWLI